MMWPDLVNGAFEMMGGFFILLSIRRLLKDRIVRGVSWLTTAFFMTWGYWNLFYYPHLEQWASVAGGIFIVATNSAWVFLMIYYIRKEKQRLTGLDAEHYIEHEE